MWMLLIFLCCAASVCALNCNGPRNHGELVAELWGSQSYDKHTRPGVIAAGNGSAPRDVIEIQMQVAALEDIDEKKQVHKLTILLRTRWRDGRFDRTDKPNDCLWNRNGNSYEIGFDGDELKNLWTPSYSLWSNTQSQVLMSAFWVYPDGMVWWTRKLTVTAPCPMDFTRFPYDIQHCDVTVATGLLKDLDTDIDLTFFPEAYRITEGGGGNTEWKLGSWDDHGIQTLALSNEGADSKLGCLYGCEGLIWRLEYVRYPGYYEKFILVPNALMATIAWLSFFVSRAAIPARVAMTIICFLVTSSQAFSVLAGLPRLRGQVWLLNYLNTTMFFILFSIFEFAATNYLARLEARVRGVQKSEEPDIYYQAVVKAAGPFGCCLIKRSGALRVRAYMLDVISRYLFPVAFAVGVGIQVALLGDRSMSESA